MTDLEVIKATVHKMMNEVEAQSMNMGEIGNRLVKRYPDFDVRNYGDTKLSKFLKKFDFLEFNTKGKDGTSMWVSLKGEGKEVQAEESQDEFQTGESAEEAAFVDGFTDSSAEADPAEFTDGTGEVGDAVETTVDSDFRFENEEVIITAKVFDETALPENAEMNAVKLEAGSEKYEEAKQASIRDLGTTEDDEYTFYDVTFIADGVEIEVPDEAVVINMEFKNVASEENETQSALHIQETEAGVVAQDVTAQSADGTLKSVGFNF